MTEDEGGINKRSGKRKEVDMRTLSSRVNTQHGECEFCSPLFVHLLCLVSQVGIM
jgi:hypothetical protein